MRKVKATAVIAIHLPVTRTSLPLHRDHSGAIGFSGNQAILRRLTQAAPCLQCKLSIASVHDPLEREADRVAEQVMRMPAPGLQASPQSLRISRACSHCEEEDHPVQAKLDGTAATAEAPDRVDDVLSSTGHPLESATRAFMEARFGREFAHVQVHQDQRAAASASALQARAYAVGPHLVFAEGQYAPHTPDGQRLIAHELAHTVQQGVATACPAARQVQRTPGAANSRPLTQQEQDVAAFVFGDALALDGITISESAVMSVGGYYRTVNDTIYVPRGRMNSISMRSVIHELTHCYQYQRGVSLATTAVYAIRANYDYGGEAGLRAAIAARKCFSMFNTEQQGDIVSDYYARVAAGGSTYPWSVFIRQVRARGACIWESPARPVPDEPASRNATA